MIYVRFVMNRLPPVRDAIIALGIITITDMTQPS